MSRKYLDCREHPSAKDCTLAIAGEEHEVLTVAVDHVVSSHGYKDSPELKDQVKKMLKDEIPSKPVGHPGENA